MGKRKLKKQNWSPPTSKTKEINKQITKHSMVILMQQHFYRETPLAL